MGASDHVWSIEVPKLIRKEFGGGMMLVLKLALLTCAFYLAAAVLIEATIFALTHLVGMWGVVSPKLAAGVIFGAIWLGSFLLAWHILVTPVLSKITQ